MTSVLPEILAARSVLEQELGIVDQQLIATVVDSIDKSIAYDVESQALALSLIPMDVLDQEARESSCLSELLQENPVLTKERALLTGLTGWFKTQFFKWVDAPTCDFCMNSTSLIKMAQPLEEEKAHKASRTEVYKCAVCYQETRFPRYNDPCKLLETRKGRCGEWANCFGLCCRSMGFDVRLVSDFADHVWNEVYLKNEGVWVHVDPCEGIVDKPLLYEKGWGKSVKRCIAVDRNTVADVTQRYRTSPRTENEEETCALMTICCDVLTRHLREGCSPEKLRTLEEIDAVDKLGMLEVRGASNESLPGRTTGSASWVEQRGEGGKVGHSVADDAPKVGFTRYRRVQMVRKISKCIQASGGASRGSGENESQGETTDKAFDGLNHTKWLDFGGIKEQGSLLEFRILPSEDPVAIRRYSLTSANDAPERDPCNFLLQVACEDGTWTTVDRQKSVAFSGRGETIEFTLDQESIPSRQFRLHIQSVKNPAKANSVQLARFDLFLN